MKFNDIICYFKTAPMSKKLTVVVTAVWVTSVVSGQLLLAIAGINISAILEFVQTAFVIILGFYFFKAGAENIIGVKTTTDFIQKVVETTTPTTNTTSTTITPTM